MRSFVIAAVILASCYSASGIPLGAPSNAPVPPSVPSGGPSPPSPPIAPSAPNAPNAPNAPSAPANAPLGATISISILGQSTQTNIPRAEPDATISVTYLLNSLPAPTPSVAAPAPPATNAARDVPVSASNEADLPTSALPAPTNVPRDEDDSEDDSEDAATALSVDYSGYPLTARQLPTPSGVSAPVSAPTNVPRAQSEQADATVSATLPSDVPDSLTTAGLPTSEPNPPHVIVPTDGPVVPLPGPVPNLTSSASAGATQSAAQ